jgi:hypothetical protein
MADNKFKGEWQSEIEVGGVLKREDDFEVKNGASANKIKVKKPKSHSHENDGTTTDDSIEFESKNDNRFYSGTIFSQTPKKTVVKGTYRPLTQSPSDRAGDAKQEGYASKAGLTDDDEWVATRPPQL